VLGDANALLGLRAQHLSATVTRNIADYAAAQQRLFRSADRVQKAAALAAQKPSVAQLRRARGIPGDFVDDAGGRQLCELVITAPDELRQQLAVRKTSRGKASLCLRLRPDRARLHEPLQAAKLALRSIAERVRDLDRQIGYSTNTSPRSSRPLRHERRACSASRPSTPASYSSPPVRTSSGSPTMAPSPASVAQARSPPPPDARADTGSTGAVIARPTVHST